MRRRSRSASGAYRQTASGLARSATAATVSGEASSSSGSACWGGRPLGPLPARHWSASPSVCSGPTPALPTRFGHHYPSCHHHSIANQRVSSAAPTVSLVKTERQSPRRRTLQHLSVRRGLGSGSVGIPRSGLETARATGKPGSGLADPLVFWLLH